MRRIIKFRGKSVADGSWVYGDLIHMKGRKMAIWPTEEQYSGLAIEVVPTSVGQYTNSHDCLKREIYEGDVVRQKWKTTVLDEYDDAHSADGTQCGIVKLCTRGVCLSPCLSKSGFSDTATLTRNVPVTGWRSEVLGNETDNPSLFEEICNS